MRANTIQAHTAAIAGVRPERLDAVLDSDAAYRDGGTDAHAKNYSLVLAGPEVRLAPLYDVASALPYETAHQKLRLAMKFGSDYKLNPGGSPWKHQRSMLSHMPLRPRQPTRT